MRTFKCTCGQQIFFENSGCIACGQELGWCPECASLSPIGPGADGGHQCKRCGLGVRKCQNYAEHGVCNRLVPTGHVSAFCDYCRFNKTIPNLGIPGNLRKWYDLESAKRRLLYSLDRMGLPYGTEEDGIEPPLAFEFKEDIAKTNSWWQRSTSGERVFTGHMGGTITINLREADPVERERSRVNFQETHRTLFGHFRHEIGHYYYEMLVRRKLDAEFAATFGDPINPEYARAKKRHYREGPPKGWRSAFISAYASMHPWEDFAETFSAYLSIFCLLDTASWHGFTDIPPAWDFDASMARHAVLAVQANELNRALGLPDAVAEVFERQVVDKLRWVDRLVKSNGTLAQQ